MHAVSQGVFLGSVSAAALDIVEQFDTYEDYLNSHLTETDLRYLEVGRSMVASPFYRLSLQREACIFLCLKFETWGTACVFRMKRWHDSWSSSVIEAQAM